MKNQLSTGKKIILGIGTLFLLSFIINIINAENKVTVLYTAIPVFVVVLLILFFIWRKISKKTQNKENKESKGTSKNNTMTTIVIIAIVVIVGINLFSIKKSNNIDEQKISLNEQFELTEEQFLEFNETFKECGFSEITKVEKEDTDNNGITPFYIEMKGIEPNKIIAPGRTEGNIIYIYISPDKKLNEISVNYSPIYKNGKVISKVCAYTKLNVEEKTTCQIICEEQVKKLLKSPSTAQFCKYNEYKWSKENGIILAQGYVDAQNSFGAMLRSNYMLTYNCVTQRPVSLNVDGQQYDFK